MNSHDGQITIAVVVPTLNESTTLARTLDSLLPQLAGGDEIVISDGGSSDGTLALAQSYRATVVQVDNPGRGSQIAAALSNLPQCVVLVVHADMVVASSALAEIRRALQEKPGHLGGCLGHRFDSRSRLLRLTEWWDERCARRGISYGDQGQFFRREWLQAYGGFPQQPIMEDLELSRQLRKHGQPLYLDCPVLASPRRFERLGWCRTIAVNFLLRVIYRACGLRTCESVYRFYYSR